MPEYFSKLIFRTDNLKLDFHVRFVKHIETELTKKKTSEVNETPNVFEFKPVNPFRLFSSIVRIW